MMSEKTAAPTMDEYRDASFAKKVVARLSQGKAEGQSPQQVVQAIAAEQRALAAAIVTPEFVDVVSATLLDVQKQLVPNTRYQILPVQAKEAMLQIMRRRAAEARTFADRVVKPDYYQPLAKQSPSDAPVSPSLREVKMDDVLSDLLGHDKSGAPQVITHMVATAKGAMLEHDKLAALFEPNGALHKPLMKALAKQLPNVSEARIHEMTLDWLGARHAAAKLTSDLAANDGAAYLEAVRRSQDWHQKKHEAAIAAPAAVLAATVPATTVQAAGLHHEKTPRELEKEKTANKRAEDFVYTINHALSCGTTDVLLQPVIAATIGVNIGCNNPDHQHAKEKLTFKSFTHMAGHYLKGEIYGDLIAVPLTILVQRFLPNFMNGLRKILEPLFGWAFEAGANRTARKWGEKQGLSENAPEVKAYATELYEHEVSHLPQAAVWNMFAYPLGAFLQKKGGHNVEYSTIFKSKLIGGLVSNTILIGGRMMAPGLAQKWDQVTGENIVMPVSRAAGRLLGLDKKTIERAVDNQRHKEPQRWTKRLEEGQSTTDKSATASIT